MIMEWLLSVLHRFVLHASSPFGSVQCSSGADY